MSDTKLCPFCAEEIKTAAIKCKHCSKMLDEPVPTTEENPSTPESGEPETTTTESSQESDKKHLYKIAIKNIQNDKAKFAFGKQLHEKLKIPRAQLNDYLAPGKPIVKDLDIEQAQKMAEELSIDGIELIIKVQLSSEDKKYIFAVILMLISIIAGIWSMKFKAMDEPKYQSPAEICMPEYNKCKKACHGDHECLIACNELVWQPCMEANSKD